MTNIADISELETEPLLQIVRKGSGGGSHYRGTLWQVMRFGVVGLSNVAIDLLVLNILLFTLPTRTTWLLLLYNTIAYACGAVNSFILNKYWTFRQSRRVVKNEVLSFVLVNIAGLICNNILLEITTHALNAIESNTLLWVNGAKLCAVVGSAAISYGGMRLWVFTGRTRPASQSYGASMLAPRRQDKEAIMGYREMPASPHDTLVTHKSLSVILPAYNEEEVIATTIEHVVTTLQLWVEDFEVIVVNDGSHDHTQAIVEEISVRDPRVKLVQHSVNQGYGAALVSGFAAASKELTFFMDSDGQFDIRDLGGFFPLIERYDAVLGYRLSRQDGWLRTLNARGWKLLVAGILGVYVRDIDCAFKLYHTDFIRHVPLETRGAMINAEMLYKFKHAGYSYVQCAVHHLPRTSGRATGAKPGVILRALRELFMYARKWRREMDTPAYQKGGSGSVRAYSSLAVARPHERAEPVPTRHFSGKTERRAIQEKETEDAK